MKSSLESKSRLPISEYSQVKFDSGAYSGIFSGGLKSVLFPRGLTGSVPIWVQKLPETIDFTDLGGEAHPHRPPPENVSGLISIFIKFRKYLYYIQDQRKKTIKENNLNLKLKNPEIPLLSIHGMGLQTN